MRVNTRYINSTRGTSTVGFVWRLERQLTPLFIECALAVWSSFFLRLWRHVALQLCMMLPWKYTSSIFPVHSASFISCALQIKRRVSWIVNDTLCTIGLFFFCLGIFENFKQVFHIFDGRHEFSELGHFFINQKMFCFWAEWCLHFHTILHLQSWNSWVGIER